MDYLNNDCAPDIMRFFQARIGGTKTGCYYAFLKGVDEEGLPSFSEDQISIIKYLSSLLPLVRPHEYIICKLLLEKETSSDSDVRACLYGAVHGCTEDQIAHTLRFMLKKGGLALKDDVYSLNASMDDQLREYISDLVSYGLTQYEITYKNSEKFLLWHSYRMDQVQLKMLKDPDHNQKGTYFYGDEAIVFASLKKEASIEERLAYKDKFLAPDMFQWECENNISNRNLQALRLCKYVHLFIRKTKDEHGITQPFIYVGEGQFSNERKQEKLDSKTGKNNVTYLYDIPMKTELPDYLRYDFGIAQ